MNAQDILDEIKPLGRESYRKVLMQNHGIPEPCYGVKIEDLKKIQKRIKKDYALALELYDTGVYDAQYLAGLIADDARMTKADLQSWVERSAPGSLGGFTVPGVAAGNPHGWALAQKWIDSKKAHIAAAGWATFSAIVSVKPDAELDIPELEKLLHRVRAEIHSAPDIVRYQMNNFLIAAGGFVVALTPLARKLAKEIGPVHADLGNNSCQVPSALEYLKKIEDKGNLGKKRKSAKC